ncbi:MAG: hypothetical protein ABH879_03075 [archaeon]
MKGAMKILPLVIAAAELVSCAQSAPRMQQTTEPQSVRFNGRQELATVQDEHGNTGYAARIGNTPYGVVAYHKIAALAETVAKRRASYVEQVCSEDGLGIEDIARFDVDGNSGLDSQEFMAFCNAYRP